MLSRHCKLRGTRDVTPHHDRKRILTGFPTATVDASTPYLTRGSDPLCVNIMIGKNLSILHWSASEAPASSVAYRLLLTLAPFTF
jgi:hypothetical protein